jgi:hypothetical protein
MSKNDVKITKICIFSLFAPLVLPENSLVYAEINSSIASPIAFIKLPEFSNLFFLVISSYYFSFYSKIKKTKKTKKLTLVRS